MELPQCDAKEEAGHNGTSIGHERENQQLEHQQPGDLKQDDLPPSQNQAGERKHVQTPYNYIDSKLEAAQTLDIVCVLF